MDIFLWGVFPYLVVVVLVGGLIWRYRYDQFGWTTRSSQLYESRTLRVASPLFHYALLIVAGGHLIGLLIPKVWTDGLGLSQDTYHLFAVSFGATAGLATIIGTIMLIYRRRTVGPVFMATTRNDKGMYVVLGAVLVLGMWATLTGDTTPDGGHHNYRETVSVWFRSLFTLQPRIEDMAAATLQFKVHVFIGMVLFAIIPFTRLIHAFTAPLHYLFRPYLVYRARAARPEITRTHGRGWEPVGTPDRERDPDEIYRP